MDGSWIKRRRKGSQGRCTLQATGLLNAEALSGVPGKGHYLNGQTELLFGHPASSRARNAPGDVHCIHGSNEGVEAGDAR